MQGEDAARKASYEHENTAYQHEADALNGRHTEPHNSHKQQQQAPPLGRGNVPAAALTC